MIIPAIIVKIIGFKTSENSEVSPYPIEGGNILRVQIDTGAVIDIKMNSTDKEFSESLKDFIESKTKSIVKKTEIKSASSDILLDEENYFEKELEEVKNELLQNNPELSGKKLKKEASDIVANRIVFQKRLIKQKSILRIPLAISNGNNGTPYYNSRSIQVIREENGDKKFGNGGIYSFAQTTNIVPLEITPIYNRQGAFVGYFKVETGLLITGEQISFLIKHTIRTVKKVTSNNKKPFLINTIINKSTPNHISSLLIEINKIERLNRDSKGVVLEQSIYDRYIELLTNLESLLISNPRDYRYFKSNIPLLLEQKFIKKAILEIDSEKGKSPLQTMSNAIPAINFSKENPNIKNAISKEIDNYLLQVTNGLIQCKLLATMSFPAPDIFNESESWGFLLNNIDTSKLTLSYRDSENLLSYLNDFNMNK